MVIPVESKFQSFIPNICRQGPRKNNRKAICVASFVIDEDKQNSFTCNFSQKKTLHVIFFSHKHFTCNLLCVYIFVYDVPLTEKHK